jgi:hypothetical protein
MDVFKYMLYSYRELPFTDIYLFILLDNEFKNQQNELENYIYNNFSNLNKHKIHITFDRYYQQSKWIPFMSELFDKFGPNELVWFTQNDDHIFIDFNMEILNEGLELLKNDPSKHKSLYYSHWPEILKMSGKYQEPILINNYIKFKLSLLDSIQIFNLQLLFHVIVEYKWKTDHNRIDSVLNELARRPSEEDPLNQTIYVPLREIVRHFDGYDHARMDRTACGPLILPCNTFIYSDQALIKKITANHTSFWTNNNLFQIPEKWIQINLSLHKGTFEHCVPQKKDFELLFENDIQTTNMTNAIPISLGWNCSPAIFRAKTLNFTKNNNYLTCPFDLCVTPFLGLCECLLDNFDRNKFFNLRVEYDQINKQNCILNEYNMWFNHESEEKQNDESVLWHPGKYSENNYELFKKRYEMRIQNFLNYIQNYSILFLIKTPYYDLSYLTKIIKHKYPFLNFKIVVLNETDNIFYEQHLHSHGFPKNKNDNLHLHNFTHKMQTLFINNNIQKCHYRAVILVLASNNNSTYNNFKKIWKSYMKIDPSIKVFFVYGKLTEPLEDYDQTCDIVFPNIEEHYPVYIKKTIEAMKIIHSNISYDYFVRTNLSTIWDFGKLHLHLKELPLRNCYSGDGPLDGFGYNPNGYYLSGVDTIVTSEMIHAIISNEHLVDFNLVEDAAMGKFFNGLLGAPMLPNRICFFEDIVSVNEIGKIDTRIDEAIQNNKDHYRIKTLRGNRAEIDFFIAKHLLQKIYNIYLN